MNKTFFGAMVGGLVCLSAPALALDYNNHTKCSQMNALIGGDNPNQSEVLDVFSYVTGVFSDLDSSHVENGDPGIVAKWSDDGMAHNVELVASWCSAHPKETVFNASAEVYNGLRSLEMALGAAQ